LFVMGGARSSLGGAAGKATNVKPGIRSERPRPMAAEAGANREVALDRIGGALWGMFIGDALAMPTHWFYGGENQVKRTYGGQIQGYTKPSTQLSGSIMNLSSTGGGGRGSDKGDIIGNIINHGKKEYWTAQGSYHYHCTLEAGENTLECQLARLLVRTIAEDGGSFSPDNFRTKYVEFMTTPGSHNDCYASTCHRMFFANMQRGLAPEKCPDNDNHNVDTIDGIALTVPVALALAQRLPLEEVQQQAAECAAVTRNSPSLQEYVAQYAGIMNDLVQGTKMNEALTRAGWSKLLGDASRRSDPVVA
jgi:ADP-ribosyl-[dinitrogen reductase] hydrolase